MYCHSLISDINTILLHQQHSLSHESWLFCPDDLGRVKDICGAKHSCSYKLTNALEDNVEERDDRPFDKAVQLVNKGFFDHLVSRNKHHPLAASPQAEHWTILLSKLHSKTDLKCFTETLVEILSIDE